MALEILSLCPFPASTLLWEDAPNQHSLTVVVKGTFVVVPGGEVTLARTQEPLGREQHWENNPLASLYTPGDFAPVKPKVDLLLVGRAHAPGASPVTSLDVRFRVGEWSKTLRVLGERRYRPGAYGLEPSEMAPFLEMPLRFERAPLGPNNPVGFDPSGARSAGALASSTIETLEPRAFPSFGPIAPNWRSRRVLVDEAALTWAYGISAPGRSTLGPPPRKVELAFFNAAPRDQQIDLLRPATTIELEGLSPLARVVTTSLPRIRPQAFLVAHLSGKAEEIPLRCDTLWIDADRGLLTLTWRGLTEARSRDETRLGRLVVAADPEGRKLRWEAVERILREGSEGGLNENDPLARRYDAVKNAATSDGYLPAPKVDEPIEEPTTSHESTGPIPISEDAESTHDSMPAAGRGVLPFDPNAEPSLPPPRASSPVVEEPPRERHEWDHDWTREVAKHAANRPATPFETPVARTEPPPPMPAASPQLEEPSTSNDDRERARDDDREAEAGPREEVAELVEARYFEKSRPIADEETAAATPFEAKPVAPPVFVGAPRESLAPEAIDEGWTLDVSTPKTTPAPSSEEAAKEAPAEEPFSPASIAIGTFAEIVVELAAKGAERAHVLERHGLDDARFSLVDRHWTRELAEHNDRGERELLHAYDAAYVAAQEREKKPIGVREYARILVGVERGEVGKVLADLELQLSDLMRIQRVWTRRVADTPQLGAELSKAVEAARKAKA